MRCCTAGVCPSAPSGSVVTTSAVAKAAGMRMFISAGSVWVALLHPGSAHVDVLLVSHLETLSAAVVDGKDDVGVGVDVEDAVLVRPKPEPVLIDGDQLGLLRAAGGVHLHAQHAVIVSNHQPGWPAHPWPVVR